MIHPPPSSINNQHLFLKLVSYLALYPKNVQAAGSQQNIVAE
jgi:hypothetical protein